MAGNKFHNIDLHINSTKASDFAGAAYKDPYVSSIGRSISVDPKATDPLSKGLGFVAGAVDRVVNTVTSLPELITKVPAAYKSVTEAGVYQVLPPPFKALANPDVANLLNKETGGLTRPLTDRVATLKQSSEVVQGAFNAVGHGLRQQADALVNNPGHNAGDFYRSGDVFATLGALAITKAPAVAVPLRGAAAVPVVQPLKLPQGGTYDLTRGVGGVYELNPGKAPMRQGATPFSAGAAASGGAQSVSASSLVSDALTEATVTPVSPGMSSLPVSIMPGGPSFLGFSATSGKYHFPAPHDPDAGSLVSTAKTDAPAQAMTAFEVSQKTLLEEGWGIFPSTDLLSQDEALTIAQAVFEKRDQRPDLTFDVDLGHLQVSPEAIAREGYIDLGPEAQMLIERWAEGEINYLAEQFPDENLLIEDLFIVRNWRAILTGTRERGPHPDLSTYFIVSRDLTGPKANVFPRAVLDEKFNILSLGPRVKPKSGSTLVFSGAERTNAVPTIRPNVHESPQFTVIDNPKSAADERYTMFMSVRSYK